jgi:hypothetical protein
MSKDKKPAVKVKIYSIDTNLDVSDVLVELLYKPLKEEERVEYQQEINDWLAKPEASRGPRPQLDRDKMTGSEFFKDIVLKAIQMAHKTGNTASLRRTKAIADLVDHAIEKKKGILEIMDEDFKYMKSAMGKAENWENHEGVARAVIMVEDAINKAEADGQEPSDGEPAK